MMEGRTTRSRRKLAEQATSTADMELDGPPAKLLHLSDTVTLTPPPSQHPQPHSYYSTRNKRRQELDESHGRYGHMDASTSSSSSDPQLMHPSLHSEEYSIGFDMSSIVFNDTFLSASGVDMGENRPASELDTPPGTPIVNTGDVPTPMYVRPETPTPRPETPGDINPLTPGVDSEVFDASSLVGATSLSTYGPPPTPMCPPRVGSLSSSSLCVKMPLSSANSTASASAAPPLNILESDEDDDNDDDDPSNDVDDLDNIAIVSVTGTRKTPPCLINSDNSCESTSADMIVTDPRPALTSSISPPHSPESLLSKHSHRLRIRAPAPRSCRSSSRSRRKSQASNSPTPSSSQSLGGTRHRNIHEVTQRLHSFSNNPSKSSDSSTLMMSSSAGSMSPQGSIILSSQSNFPVASQIQEGGRSTRSSSVTANKQSTPIFLKPSLPSPSQVATLRRPSPPKSVESVAPPVIPAPPKRFLSLAKTPTLPAFLKRPPPPNSSQSSYKTTTNVSTRTGGTHKEATPSQAQSSSSSSSSISATTRTTTSSSSSPPYTEIYKNRRKSKYVRDGNLLSVKLINFMAHGFFWKTLNSNVNIFSGPNGSGKSAVPTAIVIVLGDKAVNTQRTSSVKNFIKKGCSEAFIEVRLCNSNGSLSKEKYGEVIVLSRKIKSSGSSVYQVEMPSGGKRKINVHEVAMIAHALQIDPNNPVQFLQQDKVSESSKGNKQSGRERFLKFKQSTQLQAKEDLIEQALENLNVTKESIKVKEKDRKMFALMEQQLRKQCEQIEKLEESENKIAELENEFHWTEVKVREEKLQEVRKQKEQTYLTIKENKECMKKLEHEIANFSLKQEKHQKEYSAAKKDLDALCKEVEIKEAELSEQKRTQRRVQTEHGLLLGEIKKFNEELIQLQGKTNEERISYEEHNQKISLEIQRLTELKEVKESEQETLRLEKDNLYKHLNEFKAKIHACNEEIKKLQYQQNQTNKELNKSKANFGKGMTDVVKLVEKTKDWIIPPVGPLASYISVPDENRKYAPLIEHILYNCLFTFVVQRREDLNRFKVILNEVYEKKYNGRLREKQASVICIDNLNVNDYMGRVRPVKQKLAKLNFQTVLSMVSVKHPVAEVTIIEIARGERTPLFDNNTAAAQIMKDTNKCPPEVSVAYTLDWFRVVPAPRLQFQVLPRIKYATDIIPMAKAEVAIQIKEKIAREQEVINTCRGHLKGYKDGNTVHTGLERRHEMADNNMQMLYKEIQQIKNRMKQAQASIKQSNSQEQNNKDIASEIDGVLEMRAERERAVQIRLHELELVKAKINRIQNEKEEVENQIPAKRRKLEDLEAHQNGAHGSISKLEREAGTYRIKIERSEKEFNQLSLQNTKIWDDLNEKQKLATGTRPKILDREPAEVKRETEDLRNFLKNNSDKLKRKSRVFAEHKNSLQLVQKITADIIWMKELSDRLEPYIKVGRDCYDKMKRATGVHLKSNFQALVEAHGLTGDLIIDWKKETLGYYVSPDKQADARAKRNYSKQDGETIVVDKKGIDSYYSSLSGGERSKALVFYIMAMWKITDLPFHCLDEFEACLDEQARNSIHETLIKHARNHMDAQFFVFTPLDLVGIPRDDPFITIHSLSKVG